MSSSWSNLNHGKCPLCNSLTPVCTVCWGEPITEENIDKVKKRYKSHVRHRDGR